MSEDSPDTPSLPSVLLLKQHRAIAVKQLTSITETLRDIDNLLALHEPCLPTFAINDKVVSLSAPNKNRVGIVTKITSHFIYVAPLDNKYQSFKKDPQNLSHYSFLSLVASLPPNVFSAPQLLIENQGEKTPQRRSSRRRTSSSSHSSPIDTSPNPPPSPRKLSPVTPTQRFTNQPPPISSPRNLSPASQTKEGSGPITLPALNSSPTSSSSSNSPHKLSPTISHLRPGRSYRTRTNTSSTTTSSTTINLRQSTRSSNTTYSVRKRSRPERVPTPPSNSPIQNLAVASTPLETPSPATGKRLRLQHQIDRGLQYSGKTKPTTRITQATIRKRLKRSLELNSLLAAQRHESTQKPSPSNSDRTAQHKN